METMDLQKAKELLLSGDYTCVLCKNDAATTSTLSGVKPLVQWLESDSNFEDYAAADRVVGKATAFLYVLLRVKAVYAKVISKSALAVLEEHGIAVDYDVLAENIMNRKGDGICPFESAVLDISDAMMAHSVIIGKMRASLEFFNGRVSSD